jgi:hypothetical protein
MPAVRTTNKRSARLESNRPAMKRVTRSSAKKSKAPAVQTEDSAEDFLSMFVPGDDDELAATKYHPDRAKLWWHWKPPPKAYTPTHPEFWWHRLTPEMCPWWPTAKEPTYSPTDPLALLD